MDLEHYDIEELLLTAIKSEVESKELYKKLAKKTKNGLLEDKLIFLANEEERHRIFIEEIFMNHYPDKEIKLPKETVVPLPKIEYNEETPLSIILNHAMQAEISASKFYRSLSERFEKGSKIQNTLKYFADMEVGHFRILETEKESMESFEEGDVYWPMVHVGP